MAIFALGRSAHLAAHVVNDEVKSVTNTQHGRVELEQSRIGGRRVGVVHRRGAAGEDDADWLVGLNFSERCGAWQDDGEDILLANTPRDQLRILRAEIEDNDCLGVHSLVWQGGGRAVKKLCGAPCHGLHALETLVFGQIADDEFERVAMGEYSREEDARSVRYATRQPILAADETVIGYKLLFRSDVVSHFAWKETEGASRAAIEISSLLGLNVLCDNRPAFIQCTRDVLLKKYLTFLPANKVVAQIGRKVLPDGEVEEACRALKTAGYRFAFNEFSARDPRESIIDLADFLVVDIKQVSWEDILRVTQTYGNKSLGLLAENVETREEFEYAQKAGFHYFKGYFFRKPEMIRTRAVPANRVDLSASAAGCLQARNAMGRN